MWPRLLALASTGAKQLARCNTTAKESIDRNFLAGCYSLVRVPGCTTFKNARCTRIGLSFLYLMLQYPARHYSRSNDFTCSTFIITQQWWYSPDTCHGDCAPWNTYGESHFPEKRMSWRGIFSQFMKHEGAAEQQGPTSGINDEHLYSDHVVIPWIFSF